MAQLKYTEQQIKDYHLRNGLLTPDEARNKMRSKGYSDAKIEEELQVGPALESLLALMKEYAHKNPGWLFEDEPEAEFENS